MTYVVYVVESKDIMDRVADLIQKLDNPLAAALETKMVKMRFADAAMVADTINSVLSGSTPPRTNNQNASFQQRVFGGGRFGGFGRGVGGGFGGQQSQAGRVVSTDPFGKVVAYPPTNSLIITATAEKMARIDDLIGQLDVQVPVETTTYVIPLKNAQAQD